MDIRDLLVRHEKLVHLNDSNKDGPTPNSARQRKASAATTQSSPVKTQPETDMFGMQQQQSQPLHNSQPHYSPDATMSAVVAPLVPDSRIAPRPAAACNLDLLSDAATHLASGGNVNPMQSMMTDMSQGQANLGRVDGMPSYNDRRDQDPNVYATSFPGTTAAFTATSAPFAMTTGGFAVTSPPFGITAGPPQSAFDNYTDFFMDDVSSQAHILPMGVEDQTLGGVWPRPISSFPSRFPSLAPDGPNDGTGRLQDDGSRVTSWRISANDHAIIKNRLDGFSSVLPEGFIFPSRHTLTRYLDGYISGFQEHLPFLHISTLSPTEIAPELLLAIASVGAQYRFEGPRGHALWYAAKAVALEQTSRRHSHEIHTLLPTPAAYSPHSTRASPSSGFRHSFTSVHSERPMTQETHREP